MRGGEGARGEGWGGLDVGEDVFEVLAGGVSGVEAGVERGVDLVHVEDGGGHAGGGGGVDGGADAVIAGQRDPDIVHAAVDVFIEPGEEGVEVDVDGVY